ncbi:DUF4214 domain-containing protein [Pararhizobium haloflavum]|uniref:DUF4214 domain-containing protein n=1 Tax=Pararhizobium haloflavum TaxID=2037914 RepID=UPI000C18D355|nr:DUF4214 domain-containing protein [Pararhizobium haloflavum]
MATIQGVYIALFGRPADPLGLAFYENETNNGEDLSAIYGALASSAEYQDRFEGMMSSEEIVNSVYMSLFGRGAEPDGLAYWAERLDTDLTIEQIAIAIYDSAMGDDMQTLMNKEIAANNFTSAIDTEDEIEDYQGEDAADAGRAFLDDVTSDPATIPTDEETDAAIAGLGLRLTEASNEMLTGGDGDDAFSGAIGGDNPTVNDGDSIDGGAGSDSFSVVVAGSDDDPVDPQLTDVEAIDVTFTESSSMSTPEISLAEATGVERVSVSNSNAFGSVSNIGNVSQFRVMNQGASVGFAGTTAAALSLMLTDVVDADEGDLVTIDFDDITATSLEVSVEDSAAALGIANVGPDLTADDTVETLTIESNGESNLIGVSGTSALATINLTGMGDVTLVGGTVNDDANPGDGINAGTEFTADGFAAVELLNAADLEGDLAIDLSNATGAVTARGGSGNDTITTGAGDDLVTGGAGDDTLDGGAGDNIFGGGPGNDTIILTSGGNDEVHVDAGVGLDTVTDFVAAEAEGATNDTIDVVSFLQGGAITFANSMDDDVRGDGDLAEGDFQIRTDLMSLSSDDDQKVVLITDGMAADEGVTQAAIDAATSEGAAEFYLAVFNSESGDTEIYHDEDWSDTDGREHLMSLTGVNSEDLTRDNFDVYV